MLDNARDWFTGQGISESIAEPLGWASLIVATIIAAWLAHFVARRILLVAVSYVVKRSRTRWDDVLLEHRFFSRLSHLAPALVIYYVANLFPPIMGAIQRFSTAYMVLAGLLVINAFLNAAVDIYRSLETSRDRPIKGYVQVAKIIIFVFLGIYVVAILLDSDPTGILTGLGAMTAVLILVFKDSILGFVASMQLSMNDMVRIGDWIEMPKFGADGDVIDVTLHTVKVQNWDKTISTIPAYALISDTFKNWRGMSESGGRRIKRSLNIDVNSIRFCDDSMLHRFEKINLLKTYLKTKRTELTEHNAQHADDPQDLINSRRLTNVGTFRAYMVEYLKNHPKIHQEMTFLVRQLPPGDHGLPIEMYVFSNDQDWVRFEDIQSDIFDHLLAIAPQFGLRIFQRPSGADLHALSGRA
ncbi:MAG: mechanosensitive ion channel family protein [candidate division Zixibacteria bacterium]|nr:mechanosensitive ion channel family protein [candidate division Zixibacteria bacterium]MDH3938858.1 mechanosensitive ion channel family protein [candidate division Zixibacteria bacterium]MDH4033177.1 mechanosensitive ion channel family protein [candidate division Zixibacteria bacterium]